MRECFRKLMYFPRKNHLKKKNEFGMFANLLTLTYFSKNVSCLLFLFNRVKKRSNDTCWMTILES